MLSQIKAGNNSNLLQNEIRQILSFVSTQTHHKDTLQEFNQFNIIIGVYIDIKRLLIITEPKTYLL